VTFEMLKAKVSKVKGEIKNEWSNNARKRLDQVYITHSGIPYQHRHGCGPNLQGAMRDMSDMNRRGLLALADAIRLSSAVSIGVR